MYLYAINYNEWEDKLQYIKKEVIKVVKKNDINKVKMNPAIKHNVYIYIKESNDEIYGVLLDNYKDVLKKEIKNIKHIIDLVSDEKKLY